MVKLSTQKVLKALEVLPPFVNKEAVLKELLSWLEPSVGSFGLLPTSDGSITLVHPQYGEPYHSISAGAIQECLEKFLHPSDLLKKAERLKRVCILDIGFGLGYNISIAVKRLKDINPKLEVCILSFEKELPSQVPDLPEGYRHYHRLFWDNLPKFEREGISFKLLLGDARKSIKEVLHFQAHAVFHDAFSPYRNPELWTKDFLKEVKRLMHPEGVWVSYTSSLAVRSALRELGFKLASTRSVGRKRGGTKAYLLGEDQLSHQEKEKLLRSPYAIPMLDPTLEAEPLDILLDYRVRVELKKVAQGGLEPPTPRFSAGCSTN